MSLASANTFKTLAQVVLFAGLPPDDLAALGGSLRYRRYARGEIIFLRGDPGESLFLIESGTVKISLTSPDGKEMMLAVLFAGDFFGELALLDGGPRSADALALEACHLATLDRNDFRQFLAEHSSAAGTLLTVLSQRLRRDAEVVQDAAFLDVPARVARAILYLAAADGRPREGTIVLGAPLTQAALAGMVGATRESVNKWLRFFERQGMIRWDRGRLTVLQVQSLRQRAGEQQPIAINDRKNPGPWLRSG